MLLSKKKKDYGKVVISVTRLEKYVQLCLGTKQIIPSILTFPDSKVHGANMGPIWVLSAPDGPHVGPMSLAVRVFILHSYITRMVLLSVPAGLAVINCVSH